MTGQSGRLCTSQCSQHSQLPASPNRPQTVNFSPQKTVNFPTDLRILDLSDNAIASDLPNLGASALAWVNLTNNKFTGRLPASFDAAADSLVVLSLNLNNIGGGE